MIDCNKLYLIEYTSLIGQELAKYIVADDLDDALKQFGNCFITIDNVIAPGFNADAVDKHNMRAAIL